MQSADFIMVAFVAIVCGTFAQLTSSHSRGGWIVNLGVAYIGASAGVILSRYFDAPVIYDMIYRNVDFPIIYAIVGSALFVAALGLLVKPYGR